MLTPNPNECNSTLTSGTNNIYPYPYIDINDRGHRFRSGSPLTNYPHAPPPHDRVVLLKVSNIFREIHHTSYQSNGILNFPF